MVKIRKKVLPRRFVFCSAKKEDAPQNTNLRSAFFFLYLLYLSNFKKNHLNLFFFLNQSAAPPIIKYAALERVIFDIRAPVLDAPSFVYFY